MTVRPSDSPRPPIERRTDSIPAGQGEFGDAAMRESKLKDRVHPSRRALPDYPAR